MAITTTITEKKRLIGDRWWVQGQSVISAGTNTGDVATGLGTVLWFSIHCKSTVQEGISVMEDFPLMSGDVTIHGETNDMTYNWWAIGYK